MPEPLDIRFVIGCTGCGKGEVGRELGRRLGGEIISIDSMKVYRRMDIGTAKPGSEARRTVRHHLIDVVEPSEDFSMADFVGLAEAAGGDIASRGKAILAIGGTGLYMKALSEGIFDGPSANPEVRERIHRQAEREGVDSLHVELVSVDPAAAQRIHRNDLRRIVRALEVYELTGRPISELQTQWDQQRTRHRCTFIGLRRTLEDQNHRTNMRVKRLIEGGWVEEVRGLLAESSPMSTTARQALGYGELTGYINGKVLLEEAIEKIKIATRQFAKAQRTWFKRFRSTRWFDIEADESISQIVNRIQETMD